MATPQDPVLPGTNFRKGTLNAHHLTIKGVFCIAHILSEIAADLPQAKSSWIAVMRRDLSNEQD
jgi:hypothetical protein